MEKIPFRTALVQLFLITLMISGSAGIGLLFYKSVLNRYGHEEAYRIVAIVQTTPDKESLKTIYLAELLNLSTDIPTNLYRFNAREARRKLLANPLIKEAKIKKMRPSTLHIRYSMRKPIAFLLDFSNTAMDADGFTFPFKPFFTPKKLPEIYVGLNTTSDPSRINGGRWGQQLRGSRAELAQDLYEYITWNCCSETLFLKRIDVSKADAESCGQCQIIVILEKQLLKESNGTSVLFRMPHIVRLDSKDFIEGMKRYSVLQDEIAKNDTFTVEKNSPSTIETTPTIIDLRLPNLAFYTKHDKKSLK